MEDDNDEKGQGPNEAETRCPFCLISEGKIDTNIVYSDDRFLGILDINPANPGHILLFPRVHRASLDSMDDDLVSRMFVLAKELCAVLLQTFLAKGYNIFLANGPIAGQTVPHVIVHLIPRFDKDGLTFAWEPKSLSPDQMKGIANSIKAFPLKEKDEPKPAPVYYNIDEEERLA